jgi:hypothetical protein
MDATALLSRAISLLIVRGSRAPVWKAPRYFILPRAARLSPNSVPYRNITRKTHGRTRLLALPLGAKYGHPRNNLPPTHIERCLRPANGMPPLTFGWPSSRARITLCRPPKLPPAKVPAPLQKGRPNQRPFPVPFCIACASSATICFALRPINLMQNSAQPVTKVDPWKHFPVPRVVHSERSVPCLKDSQRRTSQ